MKKIEDYFKYYDNSIKLDESDYRRIREKREKIIEELKANDSVISFDHINLGSYKLRTGVKYKNNDYDIDCGIRMFIKEEELGSYDAKECKTLIFNAISARRDKKFKNKCITAVYYENNHPAYHVDFPVFAYDQENECYYLAEGKQNEEVKWVKSEPSKLIEYLDLKDDNYKRIVRLLKKWNSKVFENEKKNSKAPSIALTLEAREWFETNSYDNDIDALIFIAKSIKNLIIGDDWIYKTNEYIEKNIYYKMVDDEGCVSIFKDKLTDLIKILEEVKKTVSIEQKCSLLRKVFADFPIPEKESVKESFAPNARYA